MKDVREHPNYARTAMTIAEAESHAIKHQTVAAFRLLKALDEREARIEELMRPPQRLEVTWD